MFMLIHCNYMKCTIVFGEIKYMSIINLWRKTIVLLSIIEIESCDLLYLCIMQYLVKVVYVYAF